VTVYKEVELDEPLTAEPEPGTKVKTWAIVGLGLVLFLLLTFVHPRRSHGQTSVISPAIVMNPPGVQFTKVADESIGLGSLGSSHWGLAIGKDGRYAFMGSRTGAIYRFQMDEERVYGPQKVGTINTPSCCGILNLAQNKLYWGGRTAYVYECDARRQWMHKIEVQVGVRSGCAGVWV